MSFLEGFTQGGLFGSAKMPGGAEVICEETTDIEESQFRDLLKPFLASAPAPAPTKNKIQEYAEAKGELITAYAEDPAAISEAEIRAAARTKARLNYLVDITKTAPKPVPSDYLDALSRLLRKLEKDLMVQIRRDGAGRLYVVPIRDESNQRKLSDVGIKNPITRRHDK